jgi:hypoxanthine-DNA glycosylase
MVTDQRSFPFVSGPEPLLLILGSFPGKKSLQEGQYYAHPRNAFWPIMGRLFGAGPELPYKDRLERLRFARVALWDVLLSCERTGSMDGAILADGAAPNDFQGFFRGHPTLLAIFFNGRKATELFERFILPGLDTGPRSLARKTLPSTSPAYASKNLDQKAKDWRVLLELRSARP